MADDQQPGQGWAGVFQNKTTSPAVTSATETGPEKDAWAGVFKDKPLAAVSATPAKQTPQETTPDQSGWSGVFKDKPAQPKAPSAYEDPYGRDESVLSRPLLTYAGVPEYGWFREHPEEATGFEKGAEKFVSGLTSPIQLGLMLATGGLGGIAEASAAGVLEAGGAELAEQGAAKVAQEAGLKFWGQKGAEILDWAAQKMGPEFATKAGNAATVVNKLASFGFTVDQLRGSANLLPQIAADMSDGDWNAATEHMTEFGLGAGMAALGVSHIKDVYGKERYTYTPDREALGEFQKEMQKGNIEAYNLEKTHKDLLRNNFDINGAMRWYHEAGGLKGERAEKVSNIKLQMLSEATPKIRDTVPPHPFPNDDVNFSFIHHPKTGEAIGTRIQHANGAIDTITLNDGKTVQVKGIIGSVKGVGQRLYDTAIRKAMEDDADEFRSDEVMTEDAKNAWQRLSNKYDVTRNADGTYSIDLTKLRAQPTTNRTMENLLYYRKSVQEMTHLRPAEKELILRRINDAMNLSDEHKKLAESFRPLYSKDWEDLKAAGLVHKDAVARENYSGNRQYNPDDEELNAYRPTESTLRVTKKPGPLKGRKFDNMIDALEQGYVPKNQGLIDARAQYVRQIAAAKGIVAAEKVFLRHSDIDGRPVAFEPSRIRNLDLKRSDGTVRRIKAIQIHDTAAVDPDKVIYDGDKAYLNVNDYTEGPKMFYRNRVVDVLHDEEGNEKPITKRTTLMFHPDHIDQINQKFQDESWVRKSSWANALLNVSQASKKSLLSLSPFHFTTIGLRGLQTGLSLGEIMHPQEIDPEGVAVEEGLKRGLILREANRPERAIYQTAADSEAAGAGPIYQKIPWIGPMQKSVEDHLFGSWLPRIKAVAFEKIAQRLKESNANWDNDQLYSTAARLTNGFFGGLNWKMLGMSAGNVDTLRMLALAPDFTGSQIDTTMSMFKPGGSFVAQSFAKMMFYNLLVAQATNLLLHGKVNMQSPFSVMTQDGKKAWGMRTMPEDVWRSLTDTNAFFANRLNPLVKTGIEALYHRDAQGKRLSDEQLVGEAIKNIFPLSMQSLAYKAAQYALPKNLAQKFKTGSSEDTFYDSILRGVGLNPHSVRTPAETLASNRLNDRLPAGTVDPSAVNRHHLVLDAEDQLRSGHTPDTTGFTPKERREVYTYGHQNLLRAKFDRLNMSDALDVWKISTSEEKQLLLHDLLKKKKKYVKSLSPKEREDDNTYQRLKAVGLVHPSIPEDQNQ